MTGLAGKAVLLTGAAGGIGAAVARRLAQAGARLVLLDRAGADLAPLLEELGAQHLGTAADVANESEVEASLSMAQAKGLAVDVLVHCAGIGVERAFLQTSLQEWRQLLDINLTGTFVCCRAVAQRLVARGAAGSLVTLASTAGELGSSRRAAYGASKAGVINLTQTIAIELASHGIRANVVSPGPVETELVRRMHSQAAREAFTARVPMARYGQPHEVAEAVLFLASDASAFVTGHVLHVDGGFKAAGIMH